MSYAVAYKHLGILEERGKIITAKVNGDRSLIMKGGKRFCTPHEKALLDEKRVKTWDISKKLIFIEELATMSDDEKERLFSLLESLDDSLKELVGKTKDDKMTKADMIQKREVKG